MEKKLSDGMTNVVYGYSRLQGVLNIENQVGENGENLSIVILSCNRSLSTIKLLKSIENYIPNFKGKILIADNNSVLNEKENIKKALKNYSLSNKLIEFKENFGVAKGRNKVIKYIETDWFLNLDNDIYFVANPIKKINEALITLGCKFLNLPLFNENEKDIFANGGGLFVDFYNNNIHIGCGSMIKQCNAKIGEEFDNSLGSFIFGGSSVINKQAFIECGMFDEHMFIGFEDYDFSIIVYQNGYKIGNCGIVALVHDHKQPNNNNDLEYEKIRFSNEKLYQSGLYFEKKHGAKVWDELTEQWLYKVKNDLGLVNNKKIMETKTKPKIALIVDTDSWCFYNIAIQIEKNLNQYYNFSIIPFEYIDLNIIRLFLMVKKYDLIHFFWRGHINFLEGDFSKQYCNILGVSIEQFKEYVIAPLNVTTCVYDHNYLNSDELKITKYVLDFSKNYYVSSEKLYAIYSNIGIVKRPQMIVTDGVDLDKFKLEDKDKFKYLDNRIIKIGWVGNSKFYNNTDDDLKGVNKIIRPAIKELKDEGYDIEEYFADKQIKQIPFEKMPSYYNEIDVYICASLNEGTPNPVLEAMACGIPVISTDVGLIPNLFGILEKQFILNERSKENLKEKLKKLLDNKELFDKLSKENLKQIRNWDWKIKCESFKQFFDSNIRSKE